MKNIRDAIGEHLFNLEIDDEAVVTDVVILARTMRLQGDTTMSYAASQGTDWIVQLGLVTAAQASMTMDQQEYAADPDEEE